MSRRKSLTTEEVDAIDPQAVDSVTADKLIATIRNLREAHRTIAETADQAVNAKVMLWLAYIQGEADEAVEYIVGEVDCWLDWEKIVVHPWAHDWRAWWAAHDTFGGGGDRSCMICERPATTWSGEKDAGWSACGDRHRKAIHGELDDEQCRLCNEVRVCAFDLAGSPVCADCWPGDRLLEDARTAWLKRFDLAVPQSGGDHEGSRV